MKSDERKYNDEQMALILRRAADIQARRDDGQHSLAEIQEIAQQVGLDPDVVALAAAGVAKGEGPGTALVPRERRGIITSEFSLPRRASGDEVARMLEAVRRASGHQGTSRQVFDAVEWRSGGENELIDIRVAITPSNDRTNMRVQHRSETAATLAGLLGGIGGLIGIAAAASVLPATGALLAAGGIAAGGVLAFRSFRKRTAARGEKAVDQIIKAVQDEMAEG